MFDILGILVGHIFHFLDDIVPDGVQFSKRHKKTQDAWIPPSASQENYQPFCLHDIEESYLNSPLKLVLAQRLLGKKEPFCECMTLN